MTSPARAAAPRWVRATIERIEHATPRVVHVFLRSSLSHALAGQHVDVRLTADDGYSAQRKYSIASAPGAPLLELAIERMSHGEVSPYFHEIARPGDEIEMRGPLGGHFVWSAADGGPLLLVGGGSGVVPLAAIARERALRAPAVPALLVQSAPAWDDVLFRDELVAADGRDGLAVAFAITREEPRRATDIARRLDRAALDGLLARWGHAPRHVYVCGANPFVEAMTASLVDLGIAPSAIRTERYGG